MLSFTCLLIICCCLLVCKLLEGGGRAALLATIPTAFGAVLGTYEVLLKYLLNEIIIPGLPGLCPQPGIIISCICSLSA